MEPSATLIEHLKIRYAEPQRFYHTWGHIEALLGLFRTHHQHFDDPERVLWALYWHDAVYDPTSSDNEARSAELLRADAGSLLSNECLVDAVRIIEATQRHQVPDSVAPGLIRDLTLFLDMDLSILGQPEPIFDVYEAAIRKEYAFVEETAYRLARTAVLERFLERNRLYFNDIFAEHWEEAARVNLKRSIAALR